MALHAFHPPAPGRLSRLYDRLFLALVLGGFALFAGHLLYSALCAFSWKNFLMMDYGAYTNFLYNLAHGDGFRFLVDHNYLKTHLSFSFILLAPLVHLWDSPLLLILIQWLFLMGGAAILWRILCRSGAARPLAAAILLCLVAYPKTQSVMMSEFHGVSAYYLLLPWLLHELLFCKKRACLPLLILLGLREEAGLIALPLLLFFSVRDRWRTGYLLSAAALAYVLLAVFVLYPWINGVPLLGVRSGEASAGSILASFTAPALAVRTVAVLWLFLPAIVLGLAFRRAWIPLLVFPSTALVQALGSAMERQHGLAFHYPAPAFAALVCAMVFAAARLPPRSVGRLSPDLLRRLAAAGLLAATLAAHAEKGFFLEGDAEQPVYARFHPQFLPLIEFEKSLPKDGLLLCNQNLAGFFAMRPDIMVLHYYEPDQHRPDWIVTDIQEIQTPVLAPIVTALENGEYGFYDMLFPYLILRRGHSVRDNPRLLQRIRHRQMVPAMMPSQGGVVVYDEAAGLIRQWEGLETGQPVALAYGQSTHLRPGRYVARFKLQTPESAAPAPNGYGTLSLHRRGIEHPIAEAPITLSPGFGDQALPFTLSEATLVEPRIRGGNHPLRLKSICIEYAP
jgi:uncharacterized membrane protein